MFWHLLLLVAVLVVAYYRWSRRRLYQLNKELPGGIKTYPILGHGYMFLGSGEGILSILTIMALQTWGRVANQQGGLTSGWLAHRLFVVMTDPEAIELLTKTCLEKDDFTLKFTRTAIGNGSIFAPVKIWHPRRKISAPFFKLNNLNQIVPIFQEKTSLMVKLMKSKVGGGDFPIWEYMTTYTFDTVFETAFGIEINSQENPDHFLLHAIDSVTKMVAQRMLQPWLHPDFVYKRLPVYKQFQSTMGRSYDFIDKIIEAKRKELAANESNGNNQNTDGRINFLDMIIHTSGGLEKGYSNLELREECIVMMVAATDTSAVGSSYTAVVLSRYPDVQDKVYKELQDVFGNSDREVTPADLPRLKYLEAVIKESLRLYPPVPIVAREVHNDLTLPSGPTLVDGTGVMINIWGTHRNPLYWGADAELFRPERFLEGPLRHPAQFIPFSYSVRNCVGGTYAMMSMKTALSNLLRQYRLLPPANMAAADVTKPLRVEYSIMMKPTDNFLVRIEERNKVS